MTCKVENRMKSAKAAIFVLVVTLMMAFLLTACSGSNASNSTFPSINDADIPDILEFTVGTLGNTYFTSFGATENKDYQSFLTVTFEDTTETDYTSLMEHYQSDATSTDESGFLLFDWGRLQVKPDDDSISINAYMK